MKGCHGGVTPKAPAANAKPLVRHKGQILDFHFLNSRHNRITVTLMSTLSLKRKDEWKEGQVTGSRPGRRGQGWGRGGRGGSSASVCTSLCSGPAESVQYHEFLSTVFPNSDAVAMTWVVRPSGRPSSPSACVHST